MLMILIENDEKVNSYLCSTLEQICSYSKFYFLTGASKDNSVIKLRDFVLFCFAPDPTNSE